MREGELKQQEQQNIKTLLKKNKEDINNWRSSRIRRLGITKISILQKKKKNSVFF